MSSRIHQSSVVATPYASWIRLLVSVEASKHNDELLLTFFLRECGSDPSILDGFMNKLRLSWNKFPRIERTAIALQYLRVLSPLCERFGLFRERQIMDDMSFNAIDPKSYAHTEDLLSKYKKRSQRTVRQVILSFRELLKKKGYHCDISGRYKQLYSIHKKLLAKQYSSVLQLQDIFAFRIILEKNEPQKCFEVLNLLHDAYSPVTERFKDYVSIPKVNGYQSIHTVLNDVLPALDLPMEVQIRTRAMDEFAERGLASHWLYSRSKKTKLLSAQEHKLLSHYRSLSADLAGSHRMMYCLTPTGKLMEMPEGSTVSDFAYRIHTELGKMAIAAEVNNLKTDMSHILHHGDCVQILTPA